MRNCCSRDLVDPAAHVRDFEPIWLDDYLDYLIVPNKELAPDLGLPHVSASQLLEMVTRLLQEKGGTASSRDIGRYLQGKVVGGRDVLSQVKQRHAGLRAFFQTFSDEFEMFSPEGVEEPEFMVRLAESDALTLTPTRTRTRTLTLTLTLSPSRWTARPRCPTPRGGAAWPSRTPTSRCLRPRSTRAR